MTYMQPVDYHLHTRFSVDSDLDPFVLCERAVELGYAEIGLAEHVDFDSEDEGYGYYNDEAYTRAVEELRGKFAGRLTILKGIEVDFQERYVGDIARFLDRCRFDYRMGSVHYLDGRFIDEDGFVSRPLAETYRIYERETRALIATGMFDILGHLDYIRSRAAGLFPAEELDCFAPMMAEAAVAAAHADLVLEVNVKADRPAVPTVGVLRTYLDAGGKGVIVGTDSHWLWQFEGGWERTLAHLDVAGVKEVALFADRRLRFESLSAERSR